MAGIDGRTGKLIEEPEHIRQSIEVILTTPQGTRVMRREFGLWCLNIDGTSKPDLKKADVDAAAVEVLLAYEPRIENVEVDSTVRNGLLRSMTVTYTECSTGTRSAVTVTIPS